MFTRLSNIVPPNLITGFGRIPNEVCISTVRCIFALGSCYCIEIHSKPSKCVPKPYGMRGRPIILSSYIEMGSNVNAGWENVGTVTFGRGLPVFCTSGAIELRTPNRYTRSPLHFLQW